MSRFCLQHLDELRLHDDKNCRDRRYSILRMRKFLAYARVLRRVYKQFLSRVSRKGEKNIFAVICILTGF